MNYSFNYGGKDKNNKSEDNSTDVNTRTTMYGQDSIQVFKDPDFGSYFILADGHGIDGHFVSELVQREIRDTLCIENIYEIISNELDKEAQIINYINKCFSDIRNKYRNNYRFHNSGTTLTLVIIVKEFIITANIGDSPAKLVFKDGTIKDLTECQSPENKDFYLKFHQALQNEGRFTLNLEAVVNRWGTNKNPKVPSYKGSPKVKGPLRIWDKVYDHQGKIIDMVPNPDTHTYILNLKKEKKKLGGFQAIPDPDGLIYDENDNPIGEKDGFMINCGSTFGGGNQSYSIGDWKESHPFMNPYISINKIDKLAEPFFLLICSDGISDCLHNNILKTIVESADFSSVENIYQDIWDTAIDNGIKNKFPNKNGSPKWDDLSQIVVCFSSNNQKEEIETDCEMSMIYDSDEDSVKQVTDSYDDEDLTEQMEEDFDQYIDIDFDMVEVWEQLMMDIDTVRYNDIDPYNDMIFE